MDREGWGGLYVGGGRVMRRERRAGVQMKLSPNRKNGEGGVGGVVNAKNIKAL